MPFVAGWSSKAPRASTSGAVTSIGSSLNPISGSTGTVGSTVVSAHSPDAWLWTVESPGCQCLVARVLILFGLDGIFGFRL